MVNGIWGKKIGMTQVFSDDHKVVPVTAIDVSDWCVTQVKTKERDGYDAIQLGYIKKQQRDQKFSPEWLHSPQKYFSVLREVRLVDPTAQFEVGQVPDIGALLSSGTKVDVFGITTGKGFQGVVKRHGFTGGTASHGSKLGRKPGSLGGQRSSGRVFKGKKLPGHAGQNQRVMRNLEIIRVEPQGRVLFVKGSVPGKSGSLVFVRKCGINNGAA
jgi:large subunit ribosomal protein L3